MKHIREKRANISEWGEVPRGRNIEDQMPRSLIILDKPSGPSSHQVSSWVRDIFDSKAGHSGTLDPNATGVLPMGVGHAVRVLDYLHLRSKEYVFALKLHDRVSKKKLDNVTSEFKGEIYQKPPLRSGVKRERRVRKIHELEMLDSGGKEVLFRARCESGTYIRTLCTDMGRALGVGAHMMELRRTEAGGFKEGESHILQDIKDAFEYYREGDSEGLKDILIPYEEALKVFPPIKVKDSAAGALLNGADLAIPGILESEEFSVGDKVAMISPKEEGIAVGETLKDSHEMMEKEEGLIVKTTRVFHPSGEYPRSWK